ncbi:MAG: GNAT family N-acetyltransferase [Candidatus Hydrogenedentes bacterium]|nr:GNAT family N-acetyltransferase [Candidatus Hydrogenedentota bacterium]
MGITYTDEVTSIGPGQLEGFFVGWPDHPDPDTHLDILRRSYAVWLALDGGRCVGFINALSDGVFYAYIPLLEVLPGYRGRGIGSELVRRMTETLGGMYAIDVVCDEDVAPFYTAKGFGRCVAMIKRNYGNQGAAKARQAEAGPRGKRGGNSGA